MTRRNAGPGRTADGRDQDCVETLGAADPLGQPAAPSELGTHYVGGGGQQNGRGDHDGPGVCHTRATRKGAQRTITVTNGHFPAAGQHRLFAQVGRHAMEPIFQAGHAGSIPVIRSSSSLLFAFDF